MGRRHAYTRRGFSWFENVNPAELAKTRIDATTGASLLNHGLTTRAAAWIAEEFELAHIVLRTLSPYPADYDQCLDQAIEEKPTARFLGCSPFLIATDAL